MTATAPSQAQQATAAARSRRRREALEGYLFLLPNILGFLIFMAIPLVLSLYYAFTDWDLLTPPQFIGLQNFVEALGFTMGPRGLHANDPIFWKSLGNTFMYAIGVITFAVLPAFVLAYLLNSKLRGMAFFRGLYYLPVVASVVAIALVYLWIFDAESGAINFILGLFTSASNAIFGTDIPKPAIGWLTSPQWALLSLVIMTSWRLIGYDMVIFLAALQGVPNSLNEAALVDGASRTTILRKIIVPLITPTIFFILVTNLIEVLQVFAEPYIMTRGGPANSTLTLVMYLYQKGFQRYQMGYASALAWLAFGIIFAITTVQFRVSKRWVVED